MDILFSSDQQCALNCALADFDMCIFGEGGTGKSFVLMEKTTTESTGEKCTCLCSTGIAAADITETIAAYSGPTKSSLRCTAAGSFDGIFSCFSRSFRSGLNVRIFRQSDSKVILRLPE